MEDLETIMSLGKFLDLYEKCSGVYLRAASFLLILVLGPWIGGALVLVFIDYEENQKILVPSIAFCSILKVISLVLVICPKVTNCS